MKIVFFFVVSLCILVNIYALEKPYDCPSTCVITEEADCQCATTVSPLRKDDPNFPIEDMPQFLFITFDDAITPTVFQYYLPLLLNYSSDIRDARGCTPRGVFYISTVYNNFHYVQQLHKAGHEIAIHTVTHTTGSQSSEKTWTDEIHKARTIISSMGLVPLTDIVGFRAPFLAYGKPTYSVLHKEKFLYDSSFEDDFGKAGTTAQTGLHYPFTYDYGTPMECVTGECNDNMTYPGFWEIPMMPINLADRTPFSSMDPPASGDFLLDLLKMNFDWAYDTNRSPFGLFNHGAWLQGTPSRLDTLFEFLRYAVSKPNVFFATSQEVIRYMRNPVPASVLAMDPAFACPTEDPEVTEEICNGLDDDKDGVVDEGLTKFCSYQGGAYNFYTCAVCPPTYPDLTTDLEGYLETCGDEVCDSENHENCVNCPEDCPCSTTAPISLTTGLPDGCISCGGSTLCGQQDSGMFKVTIDSRWSNGLCGTFKVSNGYSVSIGNWNGLIEWNTAVTISSGWGFYHTSCNGGRLTRITPSVTNSTLTPGKSYTDAGFCATFDPSIPAAIVRARPVFGFYPMVTTMPLTTNELTTMPLTTQGLTTNELTTNEMTTNELTTQELTTQELTTQALTTMALTTQELTTNELTTHELTTQELTTQALTTMPLTTQELTTNEMTTNELTTQELTTMPLTTQALTTQGLTTAPYVTTGLYFHVVVTCRMEGTVENFSASHFLQSLCKYVSSSICSRFVIVNVRRGSVIVDLSIVENQVNTGVTTGAGMTSMEVGSMVMDMMNDPTWQTAEGVTVLSASISSNPVMTSGRVVTTLQPPVTTGSHVTTKGMTTGRASTTSIPVTTQGSTTERGLTTGRTFTSGVTVATTQNMVTTSKVTSGQPAVTTKPIVTSGNPPVTTYRLFTSGISGSTVTTSRHVTTSTVEEETPEVTTSEIDLNATEITSGEEIPTEITTSMEEINENEQSPSDENGSKSKGIGTTGIVSIAVVVPFTIIVIGLIAAYIILSKRRNRISNYNFSKHGDEIQFGNVLVVQDYNDKASKSINHRNYEMK